MIIDAHVHIATYSGKGTTLPGSMKLLREDMKNAGISHAIVIPDNIEHDPHIADLAKANRLIRPYRNFFLLGSPHIIGGSDGEVKKYGSLLISRKIFGIKLFPGHDPYTPADPRCFPYYELCQKYNAPVVVHTGENTEHLEVARYNDPKYIVTIARKYPRLRIIISHYFWPKLEYCYRVTRKVKNISFDIAGLADAEVIAKSGGRDAVRSVIRKTVTDRPEGVIFGSDWPMCSMKEHIELIKSLHLPRHLEQNIFWKNAIRHYGIPQPTSGHRVYTG